MSFSIEKDIQPQLPKHWELRRLKEVAEVIPSNVDKLSVEGQQDVLLCNYVDTYKNDRITSSIDFMKATATPAQIERLSLAKGDVTITKDSETPWDIAVPAYIAEEIEGLVCGYHLSKISPIQGRLDGGFLAWVLRCKSINLQFALISQGVTRYGLGSSALADGRIPCPPFAEQILIAAYLDTETERIDELITEKQKLLDLLCEQNTLVAESVIAPTSDRRQAKLAYFVDLLPGYAFPSEEFSDNSSDIRLLRGINVVPGSIRWDSCVYWPESNAKGLDRFRLQVGDVVFGMDRPWISSGTRVAIIREDSAGSLLLQRVCRVRGDEQILNRFIYYALLSNRFKQSIEFELSGISVPHISPEQITRFRIPMLSINEQRERCDTADEELARINDLMAHTRQMIAVLQELRSVTITDAVLGRIDVRKTKNN